MKTLSQLFILSYGLSAERKRAMVKKSLIFCFLMLSAFQGFAQFNLGINATGRHARALQKAKEHLGEIDKEQWKAYKDSLKQVRRWDRLQGKRLDSLYKAAKQERRFQEKAERYANNSEKLEKLRAKAERHGIPLENITAFQLDSNTIFNQSKSAAQQQLKQFEYYRQAQEFKNHYGSELERYRAMGLDSIQVQSLLSDSSIVAGYAEEELLKQEGLSDLAGLGQEQQELTGTYKEYMDMSQELAWGGQTQELAESLNDPEALTEQASNLYEPAKNLLEGYDDKVSSAQQQMAKLKQKYSEVPNSAELGNATKKSSLKDKTFFERLTFSGSLQISSTDPFAIDLSPMVGYGMNKKWSVGVGINWRETFGKEDSIRNLADRFWSYRVFTSYDVWKGFFGYAEYERAYSNTASDSAGETSTGRVVDNLHFGIGKSFAITRRLRGSTIITYNVLHNREDGIYPRPFNIRIAIGWSKGGN